MKAININLIAGNIGGEKKREPLDMIPVGVAEEEVDHSLTTATWA